MRRHSIPPVLLGLITGLAACTGPGGRAAGPERTALTGATLDAYVLQASGGG